MLDGISGYGTKPFRMLLVILAVIVLFGTLYYCAPFLSFHGASTWLEHIYASGITFFAVGYGDLFPLNTYKNGVSAEASLASRPQVTSCTAVAEGHTLTAITIPYPVKPD